KCLNVREPLTMQLQDHAKLVLGITPLSSNCGQAIRGHRTRSTLECLLHDELPHVARSFREAHLIVARASANERETGNNQWRENVHRVEWPNVPDQRPRACDAVLGTETQSRGSLHPVCSATLS